VVVVRSKGINGQALNLLFSAARIRLIVEAITAHDLSQIEVASFLGFRYSTMSRSLDVFPWRLCENSLSKLGRAANR
jgi:hypothetical protein